MIRLSIDEEAWRRGFRAQPLPESIAEPIEHTLRQRLVELVTLGSDVVLDHSFWSRRMRDDYRDLLRPMGIVPETVYVGTPRDVVLARMRARPGGSVNEVQLPAKLVAAYFDAFEAPTADEGPLIVVAVRS